MADQEDVVAGDRDMGGTMRLGLYPASLKPGTIVSGLYGGTAVVEERHRHRYEVNNAYRERLEQAGLVFSGLSPDGRLVEFIELPREAHPFFVATQAHPEFLSRPTRPHPLFSGLIAAALARSRGAEAVRHARGGVGVSRIWSRTTSPSSWPVRSSDRAAGRDWLLTVRADQVQMPDNQQAERMVVTHPGAVAVLALDEARPGAHDQAVPAPGRPPAVGDPRRAARRRRRALVETARRELLEETGYQARDWHVLVDSFTSPGFTNERVRIFLARGLSRPIAATSGSTRRSS